MSLSPKFPITICLDIIELSTACNFGNNIYLSLDQYYTMTNQVVNLSMSFDEVWNVIDDYVYNKNTLVLYLLAITSYGVGT